MRARRITCAVALAALVVFVILTRGPEPPSPTPPGTWAFAVMGDAPYYIWEELQFRLVRQALDENDLAFVVHVGDIFWRPCTDAHYREALGWLEDLQHPVVYTPGDNETFDCYQEGAGAFDPQDRFAAVRRIFFAEPTQSLGRTKMPLVSQGGEFVENARWTRGGIVFATVDMIGSKNGMKKYPGRTPADDAASRRRTEAAVRWTRETFAEAVRTDAPAVVLGFHADALASEGDYRQAYEPFITTLDDEAARFGRPILAVHGDGHDYTIDHPLRAANLTRLQVPGSPLVGWVKVIVRPGSPPSFAFEEHVVPRWKYW
jgi:nucleotide-binding universal stress UspA family protein